MRRQAFTLVELIMVIIISGIIASIAIEIFIKIYDNYFRVKTINRLEAQTEVVLEQISNRLSYRLRGSEAVIRAGGAIASLNNQTDADTILTWIGVSNESFRGSWRATIANPRVVPGWSGLIDFDDPGTNAATRTISTPGSNLDLADGIIGALSYGTVAFTGNRRPALIPKTPKNTDIQNFYNNTNTNYTIRVGRSVADNSILTVAALDSTPTYSGEGGERRGLVDEYYLAHTAYAIVPTTPAGGDANDFELRLHYNYQPWNGNTHTINSETSLLAEHVSTFRFRKDGDTIRIKLCLKDANQNVDYNISACKETAVY